MHNFEQINGPYWSNTCGNASASPDVAGRYPLAFTPNQRKIDAAEQCRQEHHGISVHRVPPRPVSALDHLSPRQSAALGPRSALANRTKGHIARSNLLHWTQKLSPSTPAGDGPAHRTDGHQRAEQPLVRRGHADTGFHEFVTPEVPRRIAQAGPVALQPVHQPYAVGPAFWCPGEGLQSR